MRWWMAMAALLWSATVHAQATRTWVSGVGDDANPCSRTAPCKTFAGAISKTAGDGEIDALDPGGYGAVTITKGMTIDGDATLASILASGTNGVIINAAGKTVILRNLSINGTGTSGLVTGPTGIDGVRIIAAAAVHIENCVIANFTQFGIDVEGPTALHVQNTTIRRADMGAIRVAPTAGAAVATLEDVQMLRSGFGLRVADTSRATVRNSNAADNIGDGLWSDGASAQLNLTRVAAVDNNVGVRASAGGVVRTLDLNVTGNTTDGLLAETGGAFVAFTENQLPAGGAAACELAGEATAVSCPGGGTDCPQPICEAPVVQGTVKNCKKCRTRGDVTSCSSCTVALE